MRVVEVLLLKKIIKSPNKLCRYCRTVCVIEKKGFVCALRFSLYKLGQLSIACEIVEFMHGVEKRIARFKKLFKF
jgi:hypothetical protein